MEDPVIPEGTIEGREFRLVKDGGWCSRYADAPGKSGKPLGEKVVNAFECAKLAVRAGLSSFLLGMYEGEMLWREEHMSCTCHACTCHGAHVMHMHDHHVAYTGGIRCNEYVGRLTKRDLSEKVGMCS